MDLNGKKIPYGTSGCRDLAENIELVIKEIAMFTTYLSFIEKQAMGIMITASHNPIQDNGVKIIGPNGEMLDEENSSKLNLFINDPEERARMDEMFSVGVFDPPSHSQIFIGGDNRPSTYNLIRLCIEGIQSVSLTDDFYTVYMDVPTPALHYYVYANNNDRDNHVSLKKMFGPDYYTQYLASVYIDSIRFFNKMPKRNYENVIAFDAAYGVGEISPNIIRKLRNILSIVQLNEQCAGVLNEKCGADYVKTYKKFPICCQDTSNHLKYVSFDGDADRIVYYFKKPNGGLGLVDGDKICALFAKFITEISLTVGLIIDCKVVQTAYANGASMDYFKNTLKVKHSLVKTGIRHLQDESKTAHVGIFFEANGHGSVYFSYEIMDLITKKYTHAMKAENRNLKSSQIIHLYNFMKMVNPVIGCAFSDMVCVEYCLQYFGWSIQEWHQIYNDKPNCLLKATGIDRTQFTTNDNETMLDEPKELQLFIQQLCDKQQGVRAFVRPSGTENLVRIFAEANTPEIAEEVGNKIKEEILKNYAS
uniref:Phosphoacetylglucosamine mutase n=1 Tax=Rhabditophanes sp. KR3021 TaxID=114890 RepID=A0AC35TNH1_9BILA